MRLSSLASARPAYYDRNSTSVLLSYANIVAPHATTVRYTSTVGAGRKMNIEVSSVRTLRLTVAAPVGAFGAFLNLYSGANQMYLHNYQNYDNTLNGQYNYYQMGQITLYAGETLEASTFDLSTGGTVQYLVSTKASTYDA